MFSVVYLSGAEAGQHMVTGSNLFGPTLLSAKTKQTRSNTVAFRFATLVCLLRGALVFARVWKRSFSFLKNAFRPPLILRGRL